MMPPENIYERGWRYVRSVVVMVCALYLVSATGGMTSGAAHQSAVPVPTAQVVGRG